MGSFSLALLNVSICLLPFFFFCLPTVCATITYEYVTNSSGVVIPSSLAFHDPVLALDWFETETNRNQSMPLLLASAHSASIESPLHFYISIDSGSTFIDMNYTFVDGDWSDVFGYRVLHLIVLPDHKILGYGADLFGLEFGSASKLFIAEFTNRNEFLTAVQQNQFPFPFPHLSVSILPSNLSPFALVHSFGAMVMDSNLRVFLIGGLRSNPNGTLPFQPVSTVHVSDASSNYTMWKEYSTGLYVSDIETSTLIDREDNIVVVGGADSISTADVNSVWKISADSLASGKGVWKNLALNSLYPIPKQFGHSFTILSDNTYIIYGGSNSRYLSTSALMSTDGGVNWLYLSGHVDSQGSSERRYFVYDIFIPVTDNSYNKSSSSFLGTVYGVEDSYSNSRVTTIQLFNTTGPDPNPPPEPKPPKSGAVNIHYVHQGAFIMSISLCFAVAWMS